MFSHQVVFNFLQPHGLQHARPPCPSSSLRVCSFMSIELVMPYKHTYNAMCVCVCVCVCVYTHTQWNISVP